MPTKKDAGGSHSNVTDLQLAPDQSSAPIDFKIDEAAQALIGHHLRTLYGEIVREPIPDQLLKLLHDLDNKEHE